VDLFNSWRYRPKPISLNTYVEEKQKIGSRAALLKGAGNELKKDQLNTMGTKPSRKEKRKQRKLFIALKTQYIC